MSYTVQSGDTLSAIADQFGTTVAAIAAANGITNPNYIQVGMSLDIPTANDWPSTATSGSASYLPQSPVTIDNSTGQVVSLPSTTIVGSAGFMAKLGPWLKPPKIYWLLAAAAVGGYVYSNRRKFFRE